MKVFFRLSVTGITEYTPIHCHFTNICVQTEQKEHFLCLAVKKTVFNVCVHRGFSQALSMAFPAVPGILHCSYSEWSSHWIYFFLLTLSAELTTFTCCPVLFICFT